MTPRVAAVVDDPLTVLARHVADLQAQIDDLRGTALTRAWQGIRSDSARVATSEGTTSGSYTDLATVGPSVTVDTGTHALVIVTGRITVNGIGNDGAIGFSVSGATTIAAVDTKALIHLAKVTNDYKLDSAVFLVETLTAGSNTFLARYRSSGGTNTQFQDREIAVIDLGSP